ncbi:MAG: hypothetical protein Q7R85_03695, partial [bacterium]|nr:hypothetical protein [bacterium]
MGGKRFRWIYFQLGQLALLTIAAFAAALAVAVPASSFTPTWYQFLRAADTSVMLWIPMLALSLLLMRKWPKGRPLRAEREWRVSHLAHSQPLERRVAVLLRMCERRKHHSLRERREGRHEKFLPLFVTTASIVLTIFYGIYADPVHLKRLHPNFELRSEELMGAITTALVFGFIGVMLGATLRNRNAFLALFAFIGVSALYMTLDREFLYNPEAGWYLMGCSIVSRFGDIGAMSLGIALGIFVREVIRYRRRSQRPTKT